MARDRKPRAARGVYRVERGRERRLFLDDAECCRAYVRLFACCERVGYGGDGMGFRIPPRARLLTGLRTHSHLLITVTILKGSPVAGWLLDAYGGSSAGRTAFRPAIYLAGSLSLLSVVLITAMRHMVTKKKIFVFA